MSDPKQPEGPDSRDIREIIRQELHEEFYAHRMEHRMRAKLHRRRDFFRDHRQAHQPQGEDPRHHHGAPHPLRGGPWRMHFAIRRKLFIWFGITLGIGLFVGHWVAVAGYHRGWALAASFLVLWMASGGIAWQLTFPLVAVVRTARAIGNGEWSARIKTRRRSGEIRVLADAINGMAERIEKQLSDQKQLLAAVSHELRTPLGHMRVLIDSAREGAGGDRAFDELEREVADLDNLVGKLLASSRLEFGQLDRHVINVATMVADAAVQAGVDPDAIVASGDTQADVDPTLLRRAVANLLDNARIHGGGATAVRPRRREAGTRRSSRSITPRAIRWAGNTSSAKPTATWCP